MICDIQIFINYYVAWSYLLCRLESHAHDDVLHVVIVVLPVIDHLPHVSPSDLAIDQLLVVLHAYRLVEL